WKARRSSVPAESVTAGPDGSSSDHAINAPSVRGYSGPYVFRIRTDPHRRRSALRTFGKRLFIADMRQALARRSRGAGLGETHQDLRSSLWGAAHIEPQPALSALVADRGLFYTTFRNLCSERSLSGRGLSLKVCGQLVHDTSPT